jgi:hypothetical protein
MIVRLCGGAPKRASGRSYQRALQRFVVVFANNRTGDAADQDVPGCLGLKNLRTSRSNQAGSAGERKQECFHT